MANSDYYVNILNDGSANFTVTVQKDGTAPTGGSMLTIPQIENLNSLSQFSISGATNANPIVLTTTAAHGFSAGDEVKVEGVLGNTNANGTYFCTATTSGTTITLLNSFGNATYTSGGKVTKLPATKSVLTALEVAIRAIANDFAANG